jgi:hypothetical protein
MSRSSEDGVPQVVMCSRGMHWVIIEGEAVEHSDAYVNGILNVLDKRLVGILHMTVPVKR